MLAGISRFFFFLFGFCSFLKATDAERHVHRRMQLNGSITKCRIYRDAQLQVEMYMHFCRIQEQVRTCLAPSQNLPRRDAPRHKTVLWNTQSRSEALSPLRFDSGTFIIGLLLCIN
jgi:hypothetical protein